MIEKHVTIDGMDFHAVTGSYAAGAWIAIINWGVCAELSRSDAKYNTKKIADALSYSPERHWLPRSEEELHRIAGELARKVMEMQ